MFLGRRIKIESKSAFRIPDVVENQIENENGQVVKKMLVLKMNTNANHLEFRFYNQLSVSLNAVLHSSMANKPESNRSTNDVEIRVWLGRVGFKAYARTVVYVNNQILFN